MWKKLKSRGAETVEYAIVLACIAAFGLMFSDNLTHTLETLMGKTGSIITNGSTNKGDKDDETGKDDKEDNNDKEDEIDKNLAWIKNLMDASEQKKFGEYLNTSIDKRKDANFKDDTGLIDSEANSDFVKFMENKLKTGETIPGCSWAFAGYMENGQKYYNVSIYNPENNVDNGKKSFDKLTKGDKIKTDVYVVDASNGKVVSKTNNVEQKVAERTDKNGNKYNVIRDSDYKDKP